MKVQKIREGLFQVFSDRIREGMGVEKMSGMVYVIEEKEGGEWDCNCPAKRFRPGDCKHITLCKADPSSEAKGDKFKEALNFIATHPEEMCEVVIELYGQELINKMLKQGDIFEYKNRQYRVLE